jgi:hypothetical protein
MTKKIYVLVFYIRFYIEQVIPKINTLWFHFKNGHLFQECPTPQALPYTYLISSMYGGVFIWVFDNLRVTIFMILWDRNIFKKYFLKKTCYLICLVFLFSIILWWPLIGMKRKNLAQEYHFFQFCEVSGLVIIHKRT